MIPICIINGPLGSGKTTLIHSLLTLQAVDPQKTLWLKTEFGDESIDEFMLQDTNVQTQSLTGGCICHVLLSELDGVLRTIEKNEHVDYIIIETSGMSHPAPVTQTIERHPYFRVAHIALVVDVMHAHKDTYPKPMQLPGETQKPYDLIVFNKYPQSLSAQEEGTLDKVLDPWYDGVYSFIEKIRIASIDTKSVRNHISPWGEMLAKAMFTAQLQSPKHIDTKEAQPVNIGDHDELEDHEGDMDVLSFHSSADKITTKREVESFAKNVSENVIRIKGVFRTSSDTWEFFNWSRGDGSWSLLPDSSEGQVMLVIGHNIKTDPSAKYS